MIFCYTPRQELGKITIRNPPSNNDGNRYIDPQLNLVNIQKRGRIVGARSIKDTTRKLRESTNLDY